MFKFKDRISDKLDYLVYALCLLICCIFLKNLFAAPLFDRGAMDDYIAFYTQFNQLWLNADTFSERLYFFISRSNGVHPKIITRISCVISYYLTGKVQIGYITMISNLFFLVTCFTIGKVFFNKHKYFILPICFLLLQVQYINVWSVAVIAHGIVYFLVLCFFFSVLKKNYVVSLFLLFIIFFRSGGGFLITIPLFLVLLLLYIYHNYSLKQISIYAVASVVYFALFFFGTLNGKLFNSRTSSIVKLETDITTKITSIILCFFKLLGDCFTSAYTPLSNNTYIDFGIGLVGFFFLIYVVIFRSKDIPAKYFAVLGTGIYFMMLCLLAALVTDNAKKFFEPVFPRYIFFSIYFWVSMYILLVGLVKRKLLKNIFFFSALLLFSIGFYNNAKHPYSKKATKGKELAFFNNLVTDYYSKPRKESKIIRALNFNYIYSKAHQTGYAEEHSFRRIVNNSINQNQISLSEGKDNKVIYYDFTKNGLIKIIGKSDNPNDIIIIEIEQEGMEKQYFATNKQLKRKRKTAFFDFYGKYDKEKKLKISFLVLNPANNSYQICNPEKSFKVVLQNSGYLKKIKPSDVEKVVQLEEEFYMQIKNYNKRQLHKIGKELSKKDKIVKEYRKK